MHRFLILFRASYFARFRPLFRCTLIEESRFFTCLTNLLWLLCAAKELLRVSIYWVLVLLGHSSPR